MLDEKKNYNNVDDDEPIQTIRKPIRGRPNKFKLNLTKQKLIKIKVIFWNVKGLINDKFFNMMRNLSFFLVYEVQSIE